MNYWWVSWYQPTEDYRPLRYPPGDAILGWWCSGQRLADDAWTIVAHVCAANEGEAQATVLTDWPEATEWRFCDPGPPKPPGDRFPLNDWMKARYAEAKP